jgi:hypothetical protein
MSSDDPANWEDAEIDWDEIPADLTWDQTSKDALAREPYISEIHVPISDIHEPFAGLTLGGVTKEKL